jgi:hypothetical protein
MFCPSCGKEMQTNSKFCPFCGNSLVTNTAESPSVEDKASLASDNAPDQELLEAYITGYNDYSVEHTAYFREVYNSFNLNGTPDFKLKWNWSAFFFDFAYLWYRKAYLEGFIVLLLSCIPIGGFALWLICGGCANYALYQRFLRKQAKLKDVIPNDHARQVQEMRQFGGVNTFIKVLMIVATIIAVICAVIYGVALAIEE